MKTETRENPSGSDKVQALVRCFCGCESIVYFRKDIGEYAEPIPMAEYAGKFEHPQAQCFRCARPYSPND